MKPILEASATKLAEMIREGEASSVEVVSAHIERIRQVNPSINAVVIERFEAALAEAAAADAKRAAVSDKKELPELHGVPCTVKEMVHLAGFPSTIASLPRKNFIASRDATAVARVRRAGAIPLGLTNEPELGFWMETSNLVYGRTNNPHDVSRMCGGSSGGEAAIIAAGGSPFGIGSDGGGSIRMPAFYCGVFGHKPSGNIVPLTGHLPILGTRSIEEECASGICKFVTLGPLARSARDLWPLLRLIAGPDGVDSNVEAWDPGELIQSWKSKRVLLAPSVRSRLGRRVQPEIENAVWKAGDFFREQGAEVRVWDHSALSKCFEIWLGIFGSAPGPSLAELLGNGTAINPLLEAAFFLRGRQRFSTPTLMFSLLESIKPSHGALDKLKKLGGELLQALNQDLGDEGILLMPTQPQVAPKHRRAMLHPMDVGLAGIFNVFRLPATAIPMGRGEEGMPIGVQAVARWGLDRLTISAALSLEAAFGGAVRPARSIGPS